MIKSRFCNWAVIFILVTALCSRSRLQATEPPPHSLAQANNLFALDLYKQLTKTDGNLVFSPYSISTCLAMVYSGARGKTEQEMAGIMRFPTNQAEVPSLFLQLAGQLKTAQTNSGTNFGVMSMSAWHRADSNAFRVELDSANGLWAQKGHPLLPDFLNMAQRQFEAEVNQADFSGDPSSACREINDWTARKTKGKITDMLQSDSLSPNTRVVLLNAIHFKAPWLLPFDKSATKTGNFLTKSAKAVQVPMMRSEFFRRAETDHLLFVEIPYNGGDFSMIILLPENGATLEQVEASLTLNQIDRGLSQLDHESAFLFLPKFTLNSTLELIKPLASLGMKSAFIGAADFSGMDGSQDLFISQFQQIAKIEVNEEGTEASIATMSVATAGIIDKDIRVDHPFIFLIREKSSGAIYPRAGD